MAITKLPYEDFDEYSIGPVLPDRVRYTDEKGKAIDRQFPSQFGEDLFDRVKANPRRGSSTDKKDAFQNLLNNATGQLVAQVPSQMPGAYNMGVGMGPGIDHGITGNLSDIQNRPFDYGMKGGLKQMPYRGGTLTFEQMLQVY